MPQVARVTSVSVSCIGLALALSSCGSGDDETDSPNVTLTFCADEAPTWLAMKNGNRPWTPVTPSAGATYQFFMRETEGGIAYITPSGKGLIVDYGDRDELNTIRCRTGTGEVAGSVADVPLANRADVSVGWSYALLSPGVTSSFVLHNVADSPAQDVIAVRGNDADEHYLANRLVLRRGAAVPLGGTLPQLDFASAEAVTPDYPSVSINAPAGLTIRDLGSFYLGTRQSTLATLSYDGPPPSAENTFAAIPASLLGPNDVQFLQATGYDIAGSRMAGLFFRSSQNRQLPFGPPLNAPHVTAIVYPSVELVSQPQYGRVVSLLFERPATYILMTVTSAYYGGTPDTWEISVPILDDIPGYSFLWQDGSFDWEVTASGGADPTFDQGISDGQLARAATRRDHQPQFLSSNPRTVPPATWGFPQHMERPH